MPFIPHTPESLIPRSDSKNPATTCKGITGSGRPCRRPLGSSPQSSPINKGSKNGVLAVLQSDDQNDGAAAFFCWQHKGQANALVNGDQSGRNANVVPLQKRTSIDTLADRLGVLDIEPDISSRETKGRTAHSRTARKETLPRKWQDVDGPLIAVSHEKERTRVKDTKNRQPRSNLALFCCIRSVESDSVPPPRVQIHDEKHDHTHTTSKVPSSLQAPERHNFRRLDERESGSPLPTRSNHRNPWPDTIRPPAYKHRSSQTQDLLSLIPTTLSPQTTSLLLAELAKPVSTHDEEGFIYMFWLTDAATHIPEPQAALSLLSEAAVATPNGRGKSDILQSYAQSPRGKTAGATKQPASILLKIGRASNVQRRMNQWTAQCGYNLSLVRFYPYVPTTTAQPGTPPRSPAVAPQKVPNAHKVERLIHLELAGQRVKRNCESCGKEHREWFEVESSREGLRKTDEIIRRWVSWSQRNG